MALHHSILKRKAPNARRRKTFRGLREPINILFNHKKECSFRLITDMIKKTIEHSLRKIELEYDDSKAESAYEKELLSAYVALHDRAQELKKQKDKLVYEFGELTDQVIAAEKAFAPVDNTIKTMHDEAKVVVEKKDDSALSELESRMSEFSTGPINDFHRQVLDPLTDECTRIQAEYEKYEQSDEKLGDDFHKYNDETCDLLYRNYNDYSLDLNSYDDDEQEFRGVLDELSSLYKAHGKAIGKYNELMEFIRLTYARWDDIKQMFSKFYDQEGLLDSSLSESVAAGKTLPAHSPNYLITPGNKLIADFKLNYGLLASSERKTLTISIPQDVVRKMDVYYLQEIIMLLQHYPKMIEKWIFAIEVSFTNELKNPLDEDDWKGHEIPVRWFHKLNSLPCMIFFIEDHDARSFMLMGDIVMDGKAKPTGKIQGKEQQVMLDAEVMQEVQNRLFNSCWMFLLYCHNTGFDPQPYIEALMGEFEAMFSYEDVVKQYQEDIAKGVKIMVQPMKDGKPLE